MVSLSRPNPIALVRTISERADPRRALVLALVLVALTAIGDYYTAAEAAFTVAYIAPIALATWSVGRLAGRVVCGLCACGSVCVDLLSGQHISIAHCANWFAELALFLTFSALLVHVRARLEHEAQGRVSAVEALRHAERLSTLGRLAAGVAHELGTPLSIIAAHAEMVAMGGGAQVVPSAHAITKQVARMSDIIKGMLDFGRRDGVERSREDLFALASESVAMLRPLADRQRIQLAVSGPHVQADVNRAELHQVLTNILSNAIHAMPSGGPVDVELSRTRPNCPELPLSRTNDYACLRIRDGGCGISGDVLPKIFDPFFTTKEVGKGTGLGLSIVYGIIRDHGGTIRVDSVVGEGTSVSVYLPLVPEGGVGPRQASP